MGTGSIEKVEFGKQREKVLEEIDWQFEKGLAIWSGLVPIVDQG